MQNRRDLPPEVQAAVTAAATAAVLTPLPPELTPREGYEILEERIRAMMAYDFTVVEEYLLETVMIVLGREYKLSKEEMEPSRYAAIAVIAIASLPEYEYSAIAPMIYADAYLHGLLDLQVQQGSSGETVSMLDHFCASTIGKQVVHLPYERRPTTTRACDVIGIVFQGPFHARVWSPSDACNGFMVVGDSDTTPANTIAD